jgi:hypothetical protein
MVVAFLEVIENVKWKPSGSCHFDVKLVVEFFDARLVICITFPDKCREGAVIDAPHDTKIKVWTCDNVDSKEHVLRVTCFYWNATLFK